MQSLTSTTLAPTTRLTRSNLDAALRGYTYQDAVVCYLMLVAVRRQEGFLTANKRIHSSDKFDDVAIANSNGHVRRQIKYSSGMDRHFISEDLTTKTNRARIDDLVRSHQNAEGATADEYRLCATWSAPVNEEVSQFLTEVDAPSTFEGYQTSTFRLDLSTIWPIGKDPEWTPLKEATDITRQHFEDFTTHFILELGCPQISTDFNKPGDLEKLILDTLYDGIGIGRYPNRDRIPVDVAAATMWLAQKARVSDGQMTVDSLEDFLRIRRDFGKVAQRFPLDEHAFVRRSLFQDDLKRKIEEGNEKIILLTGLPGAGKSWLQEDIGREMKKEGHLVARHYCYIEPGDSEVQRRITSDTMWGNVIAEILESAPALKKDHQPIYAADLDALERLLPRAVSESATGRVVIFIDGLDHISRILGQEPSLSENETDILEQIKILKLPDGVTLVLGSQAGQHLDIIRDLTQEVIVPDWSLSDIQQLALRCDLKSYLLNHGLMVPKEWQPPEKAKEIAWDEITHALHIRSEGNPLYATFLCLELQQAVNNNTAGFWYEKLEEFPIFSGEISNYYEFLLAALEREDSIAVFVAELLGVVDFGLTTEELHEIFPLLAHRIATCLKRLRPILKQTSSQGGIRIYHESFRRFILDRISGGNETLSQLLQPLIDWLKIRDFFFDVKAYRFLLPNLRRAGNLQEILDYFTPDFVLRSVAGGQPRQAINANLALGFAVATEIGDWSAICRLIHLRRASMTFEGKLDMLDYGRTFVQLFGTKALSERLLFDGRPTMIRQEGLFLCAIIDDAGEPAPWVEYLDSSDLTTDGSYQSHNWHEEVFAEFHGRIRVLGWQTFKQKFCDWLEEFGRKRQETKDSNGAPAHKDIYEDFPLPKARSYLKIIDKVVGVQALEELAVMKGNNRPYVNEIAALIQIEVAQSYSDTNNIDAARQAANLALSFLPPLELVVECAELGCDGSLLKRFEPTFQKLVDLANVLNSASRAEPFLVESWICMNAICSWTNPSLLSTAQTLPNGVGWYRQWLKFVPRLMEAEEVSRQEKSNPTFVSSQTSEQLITTALEDLSLDIKPFEGSPRVCDLFQARPLVEGTLRRSIILFHQSETLEQALPHFRTISSNTTTWLDRSGSGPFTPVDLIDSLLTASKKSELKKPVIAFLLEFIDDWQQHSQYYESHAENEFWRIRTLLSAGYNEDAKCAWEKAAQYLTAYGFRKDISLYEILDPLTDLARRDSERVKNLCARIQQLPDRVVMHTDGRSTNRLPVAWLTTLLDIDFVGGVHLLAQTLRQDDDQTGWILDDALAAALNAARKRDDCDPLIIAFLDTTRPFPAQSREDATGARQEFCERLSTLERVMNKGFQSAKHDEWGQKLTQIFLAQITGDGTSCNPEDVRDTQEFAKRWKIELADVQPSSASSASNNISNSAIEKKDERDSINEPIFSSDASIAEIISSFRSRHSFNSMQNDQDWDDFVNAFGYRLLTLADAGQERDALRLLRSFAHESHFYHGAIPLAHLAEGLLRHQKDFIATVGFTLAYAHSKSDSGYWFLGGTEYESWLVDAMALDSHVAKEVLFSEVARYANKEWLNGMGENLMKFCARHLDSETAFGVWEGVCQILELRLPDTGSNYQTFLDYQPQNVPDWTSDEALSFLLMVRLGHPEYNRRQAACVGISALVQAIPGTVKAPLHEAIRADITSSTAIHFLQVLLTNEEPPFEISKFLYDDLRAMRSCENFAIRMTAALLIQRVTNEQIALPAPSKSFNIALPVTMEIQRQIAAVGWGDRTQLIVQMWPEFPALVMQRFECFLDGSNVSTEKNRSRNQSLLNSARSNLYRNIPTTSCFWWYKEGFEMSFQEILNGLDAELGRNREWTPELMQQLLPYVVAPISLHISLWNSRIPRPDHSFTVKSESVLDGVPEIKAEPEAVSLESQYAGWIRIAFLEEKLSDDIGSHASSTGDVSTRNLRSAIITRNPNDLPPASAYPFRREHYANLFIEPNQIRDVYGTFESTHRGALAGFCEVHDTLGDHFIFMLDPRIVSWLDLIPTRRLGLSLKDKFGDIAVIFRQWREAPLGNDFGEQHPKFKGCDLIMRPDLWYRLVSHIENPIIFWSSTSNLDREEL